MEERRMGGAVGGVLMCPSWGEAGQKWLSVELNWLHYESSSAESISDIIHPSWTASYNPQRVDGRGLSAGWGWAMCWRREGAKVWNYGETIFTTKRKICVILFLIQVRSVLNLWPILGPYRVNMGICVRIDPAPPELLNSGLVSQKTGAECVQQHPPSASAPAARWLSTKCS